MARIMCYAAMGVHGTIYNSGSSAYSTENHLPAEWISCTLCDWRSPEYPPGDEGHLRSVLQTHANQQHPLTEITYEVVVMPPYPIPGRQPELRVIPR